MTLSDSRSVHPPRRCSGRYPDAPGLPCRPSTFVRHAIAITPVNRTGASVDCLPHPRGLPRVRGGSASTTTFSRPARRSFALRPAGSLDRLRGLCHEASTRPVAQPRRPSASEPNRHLLGLDTSSNLVNDRYKAHPNLSCSAATRAPWPLDRDRNRAPGGSPTISFVWTASRIRLQRS